MAKMVVGAMHSEHTKIEDRFTYIAECLGALDIMGSQPVLKGHIQTTLSILKAHISKEDNVLFWLAEIKVPEYLYDIMTKQMSEMEATQLEANTVAYS